MLDFAFSTGMISPPRGQNLVEGKKKILLFLCIQYITRYTIYLWYQNFIVQGVVFFFFFKAETWAPPFKYLWSSKSVCLRMSVHVLYFPHLCG